MEPKEEPDTPRENVIMQTYSDAKRYFEEDRQICMIEKAGNGLLYIVDGDTFINKLGHRNVPGFIL